MMWKKSDHTFLTWEEVIQVSIKFWIATIIF